MNLSWLMRGILITTMLLMCWTITCAQKKAPSQREQDEIAGYVVDIETYNKVLDLVFPRKVLLNGWRYAFVLRYKPSFDAESQITIMNRAGDIEVIEYTPVNGSIYLQLKNILRKIGDFNAEGAAKQIKIKQRVITFTPEMVKRLRESFYDYLCMAARHEKEVTTEEIKEVNLLMDGTRYLLWYRGQTNIELDLYGSDINEQPLSNESPLITWMKDVHRAINKLPTPSSRNP
jgi:hypothetical protein